jgi:hypothetical protein
MKTMARLAHITQAGYKVEDQWECKFGKGILDPTTNWRHPVVQHEPLNTRDALYGGRTEAMTLHYKAAEGETILYVDVMSLYPCICKYFKFPVGHPATHVGDDCLDIDTMIYKDG